MIHQGKSQESSVLSASTAGGNDPSLLSLRTDKSSYSVPDDGRAITIETNHQHRRQKSANMDTGSAVSAASQTSLLIEYFEGARGSGSSPSHRPSVRVKVTPSAQRRLERQGTREIEIRGNDGRSRRNASYTQRISLSPRVMREDRHDQLLVVDNARQRSRRPSGGRTRSGDNHMSLAATAAAAAAAAAGGLAAASARHRYEEEGSVSSFSENSASLVAPAPMNVEVIRETGSPRDRNRRQNSGNARGARDIAEGDVILEEGQDSSHLHPLQRRRSRSLSNERETVLGEGTKLTRRRSKSMERERMTKEQREELREQRRLNKKLAELGEKPSRNGRSREYKTKDILLSSSRGKGENRSISRDRSKSRTRSFSNREEIRNVSGSQDLAENPQLLTAVEDAIKRLILPQLEALKVGQQGHGSNVIDHTATAAIAAEAARTFTKRASSPDFAKGSEGPLLVLEPDHDKGSGHGLVLSGATNNTMNRNDSVRSRAPGFGMGPDPDFEDNAQYYPLPEGEYPNQAEPHERIRMPSIPKFPNSYEHQTEEQIGETREIFGTGDQYSSLEDHTTEYPDYRGATDDSHTHVLRKEEGYVNPATHALDVNPDLHSGDIVQSRELKEETVGAVPYPQHNADSGMPASGYTPKSSSPMPVAVAPLNISRGNTPSFTRGGTPKLARGGTATTRSVASPSPRSSVASLRRKFDRSPRPSNENEIELLSPQRTGRAGSTRSMDTLSTRADYNPGRVNNHVDDTEVWHEGRSQGLDHGNWQEEESSEVTNNWHPEESRDINENTRMPSPGFVNHNPPPENKDGVNWWFDPQLGSFQPRPANERREEDYEERSNNRDSVTDSFEARHLSRVAAGQGVRDIGALASMRSTPVAQGSLQASVHDQYSTTSLRTQSPHLGFNALPVPGESLPDFAHYQSENGDEEDMLTNPYGGNRESRDLGTEILTNPYGGERDSRDMADEHWQYGEQEQQQHQQNHDSFGARALNHADNGGPSNEHLDHGIDRDLAITPANKDEGYMSAANAMSPGMETIDSKNRDIDGYAAIDEMMSEGGIDDFVPFRGHVRSGSGNSHGMPSPLYDSAMGRGIDRIQSKDIVALMDHLTVRDAQRNARDTEILITLVRSAAEMRDSFEDLKKQLSAHHNQMVLEVGQSTDTTIAKLSGPRPQPIPVARQIRSRAFDEEKDATIKKTNLFRRALKGLGSKNTTELARIEDMLVTLLDEVEGLKSTSYAYSVSNTETSHAGDQTQSQSQQSTQSHQSHQSQAREPSHHDILQSHHSRDAFNYDLNTVAEETASMQDADSTYYTNDGNLRHSNANLGQEFDRDMTPMQEEGMRTPRGLDDLRRGSGMSTPPTKSTLPQSQFTHFPDTPTQAEQISNGNTPTKKAKRDSYTPKVSRWSESSQFTHFPDTPTQSEQTASGNTSAKKAKRESFTPKLSWWSRKKKNSDDPELSRPNSEFEEDWVPPSEQTNSPYTPTAARFQSPGHDLEKPSLEANRRSLEIVHPQPKSKYHHQLEAAAESQGHLQPPSPNLSQSTTSLNRFINHGGSYNNIGGLAPMVPVDDTYSATNTEIEFTPSRIPRTISHSPVPPPTASSEGGSEFTAGQSGLGSPEKKKKRKKKHSSKDHDDPERVARRELRRQRKLLAANGGGDGQESVVSAQDYQGAQEEPASPLTQKGKQRASHMTTGTFGVRDDDDEDRGYIHV